MYLHIGNDIILKNENILFILDYKNLKEDKVFKDFFEKIDKKNIIDVSNKEPKSLIITKENEIIKGYISNISSNTLSKRNYI